MGVLMGCVLVVFFSATLLSAKLILNAFHQLSAPISCSICSVCSGGKGNGGANNGGPNSSGSCSSTLAPDACEEN